MIEALKEIAVWFREHPYQAAASLSLVAVVLLILRAGGVDMFHALPPIFASWLLGIHIGFRIRERL